MNALPQEPHAETDQVSIAHQSFAHHAKSFRLAARFLPAENLDDIAVLYHFCRMVDDAVDEAPSVAQARANLSHIEDLLKEDTHTTTELSTFKDVLTRHNIPWHAVKALMDGCESDLHPVRIQTVRELSIYCYRVAGSVGEMMSPLLNVTDPEATQYAIDLGLGMQITNICRDVLEDAERGRVYLPSCWLEDQGATTTELLNHTIDSQKLASVINQMLNVAENCYTRAYIGCRYIPFRSRLGILIARRVYRAIGLKLQKKHHSNPLHGRTMLSKWEKLWQVGLGFLDALHPVTLGWMQPRIPDSKLYEQYTDLTTNRDLETDVVTVHGLDA